MSWGRAGRAHGFEPTDTFVRFGSRETTTVYAAVGEEIVGDELVRALDAGVGEVHHHDAALDAREPPHDVDRGAVALEDRAERPATHGSAAISASGRCCIASMIRVGTWGSFVASRSVMIRSAGSSSRTATAGVGKRAASMTSAHRTRSARSSARHPCRSASVRATKPVQLGAAGSQNFCPVASRSKAARSAGVGNALAW